MLHWQKIPNIGLKNHQIADSFAEIGEGNSKNTMICAKLSYPGYRLSGRIFYLEESSCCYSEFIKNLIVLGVNRMD